MRFLLIGGTGFIGQHLAHGLAEKGHHVLVAARHAVEFEDSTPGIQLLGFDSASETWDKLHEHYDETTTIVYLLPILAGSVRVLQTADQFADLAALYALLQKFKVSPPRRFVFISTGGGIYGNRADETPIAESEPTLPVSENGFKKLLMEQTVRFMCQDGSFKSTIVRPGNPFGSGQMPFRGQGLIATAIGCCMSGNVLKVYGREIVRDYIYIDDLTAALYAICVNQCNYEVYNIGSGRGKSNYDVVSFLQAFASKASMRLEVEWLQRREEDANRNILAVDRLAEDFGWRPAVSFEEGVRRTWQHMMTSPAQ